MSAVPDPASDMGQMQFGTKNSLMQLQWSPGGAELTSEVLLALTETFQNAGLLVYPNEQRKLRDNPAVWQISMRMGPDEKAPPAAVIIWSRPDARRLMQLLIGSAEKTVPLESAADRAAAMDRLVEGMVCESVEPALARYGVADGIDPTWSVELVAESAETAYRSPSELEAVVVRIAGGAAKNQIDLASEAALRGYAAQSGMQLTRMQKQPVAPGGPLSRTDGVLVDADGDPMTEARAEFYDCGDTVALVLLQRQDETWPWPKITGAHCLPPGEAPVARKATITAKTPAFGPNSLLKPTFTTSEGPVAAGTASVVRVGDKTWLVTAHHLFGPNGGMASTYLPHELPSVVKGGKASSPMPGGKVVQAGAPAVIADAEAFSDGNARGDLAALPVKKVTGDVLQLAEGPPANGAPVWMLADPNNAEAGAHLGWIAYTTEGQYLYYFHQADLDLAGTSGAALVDAKGHLIGVHVAGGEVDGAAFGMANPWPSVKAKLGAL